jgi:hypothetical protein
MQGGRFRIVKVRRIIDGSTDRYLANYAADAGIFSIIIEILTFQILAVHQNIKFNRNSLILGLFLRSDRHAEQFCRDAIAPNNRDGTQSEPRMRTLVHFYKLCSCTTHQV